MKAPLPSVPLLTCLALASAAAVAQTAPALSAGVAEPPRGRPEARIEHIRIEDGGAVIEELRFRGATESISVQPKAGVPAYEIQPVDGTRANALAHTPAPGSTGQRVWKLLSF